jgi:hypothetical protein
LIHLYDLEESQPHRCIRMHDMIEVIGVFYRFGPLLSEVADEEVQSEEPRDEEGEGSRKRQKTDPHIPPSTVVYPQSLFNGLLEDELELVSSLSLPALMPHLPPRPLSASSPCIHAIDFQILPPSSPLRPLPLQPPPFSSYQIVMEYLTEVLMGDSFAAELTALSVLSRVHHRGKDGACIGSQSLNLYNMTKELYQRFVVGLRGVLPRVVEVDLSSPFPVDLTLVKHEHNNRMGLSPLQMASSTLLIINDLGEGGEEGTSLDSSQLRVRNRNREALRRVMTNQTLMADFTFYTLPIYTDTPVIVVSGALQSSLCRGIASVLSVPVEPTSSGATYLSTNHLSLQCAREWWSHCIHLQTLSPIAMAQSVMEATEEFFVQSRRGTGPIEAFTPEAFHRLLTIARLMAVASGSSTIQEEHWLRTKALSEIPRGRGAIVMGV